jgi:hypothetical protein
MGLVTVSLPKTSHCDLIYRGVSTYCLTTVILCGLIRSREANMAVTKRSDDITLVPWWEGRSITWDVTIADAVADPYLAVTSITAGAAAEVQLSARPLIMLHWCNLICLHSIATVCWGPIFHAGHWQAASVFRPTHLIREKQPSCFGDNPSQYSDTKADYFVGTFQPASDASHT